MDRSLCTHAARACQGGPDRLRSKPGEPRKSRAEYIWAMRLALEDAGLSLKDFQGQGLGVTIPTAYSQPFWPEEVAEIIGIPPGLLQGGATGGAGAVSLLGGMAAAIHAPPKTSKSA